MTPFVKEDNNAKWHAKWHAKGHANGHEDDDPKHKQQKCLNPWCIGLETCPWCPIGLDKLSEFTLPQINNPTSQTEHELHSSVQYLLHLGPALGSVDGLVAFAKDNEEATIFLFRTAHMLTKEEWKSTRQRQLFADVSMCPDLQEWCRLARTKTNRQMHYNRYVAVIPIQYKEYENKLNQMVKESMQRHLQDLLTGHVLQITPCLEKENKPSPPPPLAFVEPKSRHLLYIIAWKNNQPFGFLMQPPLAIPSYELLQKQYPQQVHPYPSNKQNWHACLKQHQIPITFRTTVIKRAAASLIALQNTYGYVFFPDRKPAAHHCSYEIKIAQNEQQHQKQRVVYDPQIRRFKLE